MGMGMMGMGDMIGGGAPPQEQGGGMISQDPVENLRIAIEHAQAALQSEPDDADSMTLAAAIKQLYQILANRQKEQDQAVGNPGLQRMIRRGA